MEYSSPCEQDFVAQLMRKPAEGEFITFKEMGFCSTSRIQFEEQDTQSFKCRKYRFFIHSKSGRDIQFVYYNRNNFKDEKEVVFAPETIFRVTSWKEEKSKINFVVEEIGVSPFLQNW